MTTTKNGRTTIVENGSRQVIINEQEGHFWANLYVNHGETITSTRWSGRTEKGAIKWATRMLQS